MATVPERAGVVRDAATGELLIPASQRPDGTWRKARRVKDGYIPQEEVPTYETKGTQWSKSRPDHPIGLSKDDVEKMKKAKEAQIEANTNAAVRSKNAKRKEKQCQNQKDTKKQEASVASVSKDVAKIDLVSSEKQPVELSLEDVNKKIRNLKKKMRQIGELEAKIASGDLKEPNKEQMDKIQKKQSVVDEMTDLESKIRA